jgi:nucleotide-binding universal stress UspA family protein
MTPAGQRAIQEAKKEAKLRDASLILVGNTPVTESFVEKATSLRDYITQLEKDLIGEGFDAQSDWTVGDDLARQVLEVTRRHNAILIVLGLRQRSPTGKALLGSYEQDILLNAPCPVMTVRVPWLG